MNPVITDPDWERRLRSQRAASGADRYDEVWEGSYMMAPMPNVEHQDIVNGFAAIFQEMIRWPGLGMVMPGVNVSDREQGWEGNYRVPDVAVFFNEGSAKNCGTHWCGGPDFAVEVISPGDQTREKIPFYGKIETRELLVVDREPWQLELYRQKEGQLSQVGQSSLTRHEVLTSDVLPLTFRLVEGASRPRIEVGHVDGRKTWMV